MTVLFDIPSASLDYAVCRAEERPDTYPPGRRCAHEGCITFLHRYHAGPWCHAHEDRYYEAMRRMAARN